MGLQGLELAGKHFMVGVTAYHDHIVEFPVEGEFVCVESEPCVHALFDHSARRVRTKVLVVEYDIILYQGVFECPFAVQKVSVLCILDPETSSVIM